MWAQAQRSEFSRIMERTVFLLRLTESLFPRLEGLNETLSLDSLSGVSVKKKERKKAPHVAHRPLFRRTPSAP